MKTAVIGLVLLLSFAVADTFAQTTEGSIGGYIRDEQGAVMPGVAVTATTPAAPVPYNTVTGPDGDYRLLNLQPGEYTVTAELTGFRTFKRENIVVRTGLNVSVEIVMQVGEMQETVTVQAENPLLEAKRAVVAVNVSGDMQRALPLGARKHWSEFMRLVPGVVSTDSVADNAPIFYIRGAGIVSYSTMVDGAEVTSATNPWWGYASMPDLTIGDVQIQSGGMDAAAPLGMGAAANVALKSGTNELRGGVTFAYTPKAWIGNNTPGATPQTMSLKQPEVSIGGPIAKDRLWFYGAYRRRNDALGIGRSAEQIADLKVLDPSFEVFDNVSKGHISYVKVTGQLGARHQVSGFYNHDLTPYDSEGSVSLGKSFRVQIGGDAFSTRVASTWKDWLTSRVAFSWNNKDFSTRYDDTSIPSNSIFESAFVSEGRSTGQSLLATRHFGFYGGLATATPAQKWTITGDVTAYRSGWLGSHEFQVGVFLQPHMTRRDTVDYINGGFVAEDFVLRDPNNVGGGLVAFHRKIFDTAGGTTSDITFSDNAVYVQDAWSATPRLTLNLGVRVDRITRKDELFDVEIQNSFEVGPRLGVNYSITEDRLNILRASYMRLHEAANVNNSYSAGFQTFGFRDEYDTDLDGTFESVFVTPSARNLSGAQIIDPDYHQPYVDELSVGYRRQLPGQVAVDVGYVHRDYRDRPALVEQNGIYEGNVFRGYRDESQNAINLLTPNRWNWPVYRAIEIIGSKRTGSMEILGSYTRVLPHMAGTWQPNDPASFIQPDAFPLERGLLTNDNRAASQANGYCSGSQYSCTGTPEFTDHIVRLAGRYDAPWDFVVSSNYAFQYGRWTSAILTRLAAPDPQFGPPTVTLSNGRVVSNPLATTLRFAFPTRDEGQIRLPAQHVWNIRVGRAFAFGGHRRFEVDLDMFNVVNAAGFNWWQNGANLQFDTRNFGKGAIVQIPRSFQLNLQFLF